MSKNNWDTDWLNFSRRARRGALVFLFLFVLISLLPSLYWNYIYESDVDPKVLVLKNESSKKSSGSLSDKTHFNIPKLAFDPNEYDKQDWMKLGLSDSQSQTIINYLNKGGQLRYKEDVRKLYVIDDDLYDMLEPVIDLPRRSLVGNKELGQKQISQEGDTLEAEHTFTEKMEVEIKSVKINSASKNELMQIKGIGDFYADQILEIRKKYGGIHELDQLEEMYKMTPTKLDSLSEYLVVDSENINKINVNTASKSLLNKHPLISLDEANSIVFIRERFGKYVSLDGLLQSPYIDQYKLEKIRPYLKIE